MTRRRRLLLLVPLLIAASATEGRSGSAESRDILLLTVVEPTGEALSAASSADASAPDASVEAARADGGGQSGSAAAADAGAGPSDAATPSLDAGPVDPCAALVDRLERRRAWLKARREEQFALGGPPEPARGVPNAFGVWCQQHPGDEQCTLGSVAIDATTEELGWSPEKTPDDFDAHVILMRRAVKACRDRAAWRW